MDGGGFHMKKVLALLLICALIPALALAEATPAEPERKTVSGVLVDAAMHTVLVEDWEGEQVYFYREGDEDLTGLSDGLYIGKIIECEYVDAEDGTRLTAVRDGKMPAERERQEIVEGEAETVRETWYQSTLGFGMYLDRQAYAVTEDEEAQSAVIEPAYGLDGAALYVFRTPTEDADALRTTQRALFEGMNVYGEGVLCEYGAYTYLIAFTCPEESTEGWGARLQSMMDGVMLINEQGGVYWPETSMERWKSRAQEK